MLTSYDNAHRLDHLSLPLPPPSLFGTSRRAAASAYDGTVVRVTPAPRAKSSLGPKAQAVARPKFSGRERVDPDGPTCGPPWITQTHLAGLLSHTRTADSPTKRAVREAVGGDDDGVWRAR